MTKRRFDHPSRSGGSAPQVPSHADDRRGTSHGPRPAAIRSMERAREPDGVRSITSTRRSGCVSHRVRGSHDPLFRSRDHSSPDRALNSSITPEASRGRLPCSTTSATICVHTANKSGIRQCHRQVEPVEPAWPVDEELDDIQQINSHASNPTAPEDTKWYNPRWYASIIHATAFSTDRNELQPQYRGQPPTPVLRRAADSRAVLPAFPSFRPHPLPRSQSPV